MKLEKKYIKSLMTYFTTWVLLIWLISIYFILNGNYVNFLGNILLVMLVFISIGGFIIFNIYPKVVCDINTGYCIYGFKAKVIDLFAHHIPLLIHILLLIKGKWVFKKKYIIEGILYTLILITFYMCCFNPWKIYFSTKALEINSKLNSKDS